jgi:hypothetical protein
MQGVDSLISQILEVQRKLARAPRTQANQVFLAICAAFRLERLSIKNKLRPSPHSEQIDQKRALFSDFSIV